MVSSRLLHPYQGHAACQAGRLAAGGEPSDFAAGFCAGRSPTLRYGTIGECANRGTAVALHAGFGAQVGLQGLSFWHHLAV